MEHEKKIDTANHYDCLETDVREDARKNFKRQTYKSVDVAQYMAKKFGIEVMLMDKKILEDYIDACEFIKETEAEIKKLEKKRGLFRTRFGE